MKLKHIKKRAFKPEFRRRQNLQRLLKLPDPMWVSKEGYNRVWDRLFRRKYAPTEFEPWVYVYLEDLNPKHLVAYRSGRTVS